MPCIILNLNYIINFFLSGVGGKPSSLGGHLIPGVSNPSGSGGATDIGNSNNSSSSSSHHIGSKNNSCINNSTSNNNHSAIMLNKGASGNNSNSTGCRTTATVPPLGLVSPLAPLTTMAITSRAPSPTASSSSFAAALRSLAKQATNTPSGEFVILKHLFFYFYH